MTLRADEQGFWTPDGAHIPWHALRAITSTGLWDLSAKVELAGETRDIRLRGQRGADWALREAWCGAQRAEARESGVLQIELRPFHRAGLLGALVGGAATSATGLAMAAWVGSAGVLAMVDTFPASDVPMVLLGLGVIGAMLVGLVVSGPVWFRMALRERRAVAEWSRVELRRDGIVRVAPDGSITTTPWAEVSRGRHGLGVGGATLPLHRVEASPLAHVLLDALLPRPPSRWSRRLAAWLLATSAVCGVLGVLGTGWDRVAITFAIGALPVSVVLGARLLFALLPVVVERGPHADLLERTGWLEP